MKADLILESNLIFDSVQDVPFAGFVAVKDNKILAVSSNLSEKDAYMDETTKVMSYEDKLIMPAFFDSHVHLVLAGMFKTFVDLGHLKSEEDCAKFCHDYAQANPVDGWLIGFNWYHFKWDNRCLPTRESLDKYFPDTPVVLLSSEAHSAWVNTKALEICGITKDTENPFSGIIERYENGEPTGFLDESAISLVTPYAFQFTKEQEKTFMKNFEAATLPLGITSIIDVKPYFGCDLGSMEILEEMEQDEELHMRVHGASDLFGDLDLAAEMSKKYHTEKIRYNLLKQFVDGVMPTHTALMTEDYSDAPGEKGFSLSELSLFESAVEEGHKRGLSIKIHAVGDQAVHLTLDWYENAINKYGDTNARHAIEHCEAVLDDDFARFGKLGVIPSLQPEHMGITPIWDEDPYRIVMGPERIDMAFPVKSLLEGAGVIALGSDCPVVDNNPFLEIHRGFCRLHDDLQPEGGWGPDQKLTMAELLKNYTYGPAFSVSREDELGTLEVGKLADIVVVDGDLFHMSFQEIREASILTTIMDGEVVYEK